MASNEYNNKVVLGDGTVLIDLTGDDAGVAHVLSGKKFHLRTGEPATGECTYDADTSDGTAIADEVLSGKTAYVNGQKITGSMTNRGGVTGKIETKDGEYTVPAGYHDGSGKVGIDSTEQAKLIAENIKSGVMILGVTGSYSGESVTAGEANVTPQLSAQTILPSSISKDYFSQVNVAAIPITYTDNAAGGVTVTIGATPAA